jgi:hypothetical protein
MHYAFLNKTTVNRTMINVYIIIPADKRSNFNNPVISLPIVNQA